MKLCHFMTKQRTRVSESLDFGMNTSTSLLPLRLHNLYFAKIFHLWNMFLPSNTYSLIMNTRSCVIKAIEVINHKNDLVYLESFFSTQFFSPNKMISRQDLTLPSMPSIWKREAFSSCYENSRHFICNFYIARITDNRYRIDLVLLLNRENQKSFRGTEN